jgi:sugar lactone lactonase YvrE
MLRTVDAQPWYKAQAVRGEGPSWDARTGQLSWVDILAGRRPGRGGPAAGHLRHQLLLRRDRLFITTASRDLDAEGRRREPLAGSVWVAEPGVTGPPATPWQG